MIEYFKYIERQDILDEIRVKALNDHLAEAFLGHISKKIEGNNPSCLKLCKRVATEAFHFLQSAVSSGEHAGVTIRRLRDSDPLTYTYNLDEDIKVDLLWKLFFKRHEEIFTTADLSRAKQASAEGEDTDCSKMFYVGTTNGCESFVSKLLPSNDGEEEKAAIRAIHMAIKSRPMRKLRDLQKRKYGTPPTILGQHAFREEMNILPISSSVLDIQEDRDVDDNATNAVEETEGEEVYIFTEGEVVVFRGTDDLKFNLMLVTKNLRRDKTNLKTKICGNFLLEHEQDEEFYRFVEDKDWMNAKMAFAHVLRDDADKIVMVHLDKCVSLRSTVYRMNIEPHEELVSLSDRYEESIVASGNTNEETGIIAENRTSDDSDTETENNESNIINYMDRRQRRGRGNRYHDILAALKQSEQTQNV